MVNVESPSSGDEETLKHPYRIIRFHDHSHFRRTDGLYKRGLGHNNSNNPPTRHGGNLIRTLIVFSQ